MLSLFRANIPATVFGALAALFAIIAIVQTVQLDGFLWFDGAKDKLEKSERNLSECREGRKQDRANYVQAQRDAKARNEAEVQRIESEQQRITHDIQARYDRDLERLRAERLRKQSAPQSVARGSQAGPVPGAAPGADGQDVSVPRSELLRCEDDAAEIELGRNALIDWVNQQLQVQR